MNEFFHIMGLPLLACLIFAGIHAYLGFHVIERQVIFVDLALAQIAVLGASCALLLGVPLGSAPAYWLSLGFTVSGAAVFSMTRFQRQRVPQEAIIGAVYAVSAALLVMILSRSGEGDEQIKEALVGNILLVSGPEIARITALYLVVGIIHFIFSDYFFAISRDPAAAFQKGLKVRLWDFLFYVLFGLIVTSSVKIAGILLVFSFLVIPSMCAMILSQKLKTRLILGWAVGAIGSAIGMGISYYFDFPTAASVICAFGALLILAALVRKCFAQSRVFS